MEEERVAPEENGQSDNQAGLEEETDKKETANSEEEKDNIPQSTGRSEEIVANEFVQNEEQSVNDATQQEIPNSQSDSEIPLPSNPPEEDHGTPQTEDTQESTSQSRPPELCWYCLRSLDSQYRPQIPKQEESDSSSAVPSGGNPRVLYQTDPRPHFGVAWSSHAPGHPLWDSEGPCWGQRNQEMPNPTHTCPHCHLGLPADTLRWHEAKCLLFEELRAAKK
ncbi:hypothetical protein WMY93_008471 [Mugilogobius chulae]|uniref:Uncharacterized protein n=1 Tax=Mugilogobius chulae TaxID=88201 RepID=A0AAW0PGB0_9GOBI